MQKKILVTFLIIFFTVIIFNINSIFAVGMVSQSWVDDSSGKSVLLYRTYTSPHPDTVTEYNKTTADAWEEYNGQKFKWIYLDYNGIDVPDAYKFRTIGLAFHTEQIGDYSSGSSIGYNYLDPKNPKVIDYRLSTIADAVKYSEAKYTTPDIKNDYSKVVFHEVMRTKGSYSEVNWGTGLKITNLYSVGQTEYRYAIVKINGSNVYITDNIINNSDLVELIKKAKEKGKTEGCYVSNIIISQTDHKSGGYEVARTAKDFFKQYGKGSIKSTFWSERTRGFTSKAMASIVNLYDNQLIFPQLTNRTVLVRHINIGNNTTISKYIIDSSTPIASTDLSLKVTNPDGTIEGKNYSSNYSGYQEYYEGLIDIEQGVIKNALPNTSEYNCIGYNIGVATTEDEALVNVLSRINAGKYTKGTTAEVPTKSLNGNSDYIVIDFYYSEYEKDVYVNHLYVDKDGNVLEKQNIVPNNTAMMDGKEIRRINLDVYTSEVYQKRLGSNIKTRIADSLKEQIEDNNSNYKYMGYEVFTERKNSSDLVGTQRLNLSKQKEATLTSDNVQVNFYYYYDNGVINPEPEKEIEGSVFVTSTGNDSIVGDCYDTEEKIPVTTIPSGTDATVGIKGIPRYMVGAIETEYVSPVNTENSINVMLKFTLGDQTKTVKFDSLPYRVGYYKVTDMAVYKLKNTTIYDANHGYDGTIGNSTFDWENGKLNILPEDMNLNIQLTGINGRKIANKDEAIDNIDNYVAVNIEDKHGNKSSTGTATSSLSRVYLTTDEIKEVDANSDGIIDNADKTFSDSELNRYNGILTEKKNEEASKQSEYNNVVARQQELKDAYDSAEKELKRLDDIYQEKSSIKSEKLISKTQIENDLKLLKLSLEEKEKEQAYLEDIEKDKEQAKQIADTNLTNATSESERLNRIYQASITERNRLAAEAKCNDELDEEVYIYIDIYKEQIEAAKQCSIAKAEYAKNLEDRVVEIAQESYENYTNNELKTAEDVAENATNEYNTAVTNRQNKDSEISTLRSDISKLEITASATASDYEKFVNDEFRPAKKAYEEYRDNEYKTAKEEYDSYVEQDYVGKANSELETAKSNTKEAQDAYDEYDSYRNNLYAKYDEYKALYDEFMSITGSNENIAKALGLKINIYVQNMIVKVNNTELATASNNTAQKTYELASYMTSNEIPQIKTEIPVISKSVYSSIGSTVLKETDYDNVNPIAKDILNGVRVLAGKAEYETQVVIGSKNISDITDTVYYSDQNDLEKTVKFKLKTTELTKEYKIDRTTSNIEEKYKNVEPINIYTPITVSATMEANSNQIIDQTIESTEDTKMIQVNTPFTIDLANENNPRVYNIDNTNKFNGGYYVKFDFDVHKVSINGKTYNRGNKIPAGTWIGIITRNKNNKAYITAQAYGNVDDNTIDIISEEKSTYTVRAVAYNATSIMLDRSKKYERLEDMMSDTSDLKDLLYNICEVKGNPSYFTEEEYNVIIVNRAYDFKITDVKDISWKSVFRKTKGDSKNAHTGTLYYSGTTKWNTKSEKYNSIISRTASEIGRNPLRILPIGPYKNTDTTYINAPKMGYRFSFDMKVTGSYFNSEGKPRADKKVSIATKFYYISKDGKTYYEESDGTKEGIYLFYKTSDGKYVRIGDNGGNYTLRFTPNDGYRYIEDSTTNTLSTKSLALGNLRNITLTYQMATPTDNRAAITYYGEYKLPNSTIAVKVNSDRPYDINKPLDNGYIGVIFNIVAYSGTVNVNDIPQAVKLSYSKDTKGTNTSQWDYEGFLGFTKTGTEVKDGMLSLRLEKGTWNISGNEEKGYTANNLYNAIKGTVMLYDLDERAATDYE